MYFDPLQLIYEGMYDPCIYKALFVVGGPGAGKDYVATKLGLPHMGFVIINSDYPLEKYMVKGNLSLKMPDHEADQRSEIRQRAKDVTKGREANAIEQRLGLAINGTGGNMESILAMDDKLSKLGYETAMVFVNTDMETSMERNMKRERTVPEEVARGKWEEVQRNIGQYSNKFPHFFVIDNSNHSDVESQIQKVYKKILLWSREKPKNPIAIADLRGMRNR